ncbi:rhomboid family GlyGly-CTERM serine protease [Cupriavidus sp. YR651]|uniref:rhombosortase n=1 Tax=Cupriavidus sp. YR651 TaxID=1855315 RepID=UPI000884A38A|nr:rhomboid family GlyGly-CTERM serine protease [Cupriavidus sp. YR651]
MAAIALITGPGWPAMLATVAGVAIVAALFTFVPWLHAHGLYLRDAVYVDHQWWRVVTAMWVHLDWRHWLADVAAAAGLLLLAGRATRVREMLAVLLVSGLAVQIALLRIPSIGWYGGLSGALHGLALWAGLRLLQAPGWSRGIGVVMCLVVLGKIWIEQSWLAAVVFDPSWGFGVVRAAHAAGAVAGLACWVLQEWWGTRRGAASDQDGV